MRFDPLLFVKASLTHFRSLDPSEGDGDLLDWPLTIHFVQL